MFDFGLLPLMLSKSYLLAQLTVCPLPDAVPVVEVYFKPQKPVYISEAPSEALTKTLKNNPDATHQTGATSKWRVLGITEASVGGGDYHVAYMTTYDQQGNTCLYVNNVTFNLEYKPTIFIAKEITPLPCRLRMTRLHEQRHVAADHRVIKEYIAKIKMEIMWYLRGLGAQGPYPASDVKHQSDRIIQEVVAAVRPMVDRLSETRRKRQGDIDTPENYKYESGLCPAEHLPPQN